MSTLELLMVGGKVHSSELRRKFGETRNNELLDLILTCTKVLFFSEFFTMSNFSELRVYFKVGYKYFLV